MKIMTATIKSVKILLRFVRVLTAELAGVLMFWI
jgi:hypothetical protein